MILKLTATELTTLSSVVQMPLDFVPYY